MTRIVDFADGFTSASAPSISGGSLETYTLSNNQASFTNTGLSFDSSTHTSAFIDFELLRTDATPSYYSQSGKIIAAYDGTAWSIEFGNFIGDEIVADSLASAFNVQFQITSLGVIQYKSGNMTGGSHSCEWKLAVTRISA